MDENSTIAPGIRDVIIKKKKKMRKRYLTDTMKNLYLKFCSAVFMKVSWRFFQKLKPFWVVKMKVSARETCACKLHCNFLFIFDRLRFHRLINHENLQSFIKSIKCDIKQKNCMFGECNNCKSFMVTNSVSDEENTWYRSWVTEKIEKVGSKGKIFKV